jgi:hypothetical protein
MQLPYPSCNIRMYTHRNTVLSALYACYRFAMMRLYTQLFISAVFIIKAVSRVKIRLYVSNSG